MLIKKSYVLLFLVLFLGCNLLGEQQNKSVAHVTYEKTSKNVQSVKKRRSSKKNNKEISLQSKTAVKVAQASTNPKKRRRRGGNKKSDRQGHTVVRKTLSTMNFQELKQSKDALIADGNKEVAIKYLEKMIPLCTDMHDLAGIMIELGDLYYDTGRLAKAFTMYREFVNLYPGSDDVEYALYRAIVCKFDGISDAERDQSQTKETIELAEEFNERSELFVTYKDKVDDMLGKCRERLFENELTIFNFYLFNKRIVAANKRLESMKKEFTPLLPELEPRMMLLEIELAQATQNNELVEQKQEELITKFPDYVIQTAQNIPKKKSLVDRF